MWLMATQMSLGFREMGEARGGCDELPSTSLEREENDGKSLWAGVWQSFS